MEWWGLALEKVKKIYISFLICIILLCCRCGPLGDVLETTKAINSDLLGHSSGWNVRHIWNSIKATDSFYECNMLNVNVRVNEDRHTFLIAFQNVSKMSSLTFFQFTFPPLVESVWYVYLKLCIYIFFITILFIPSWMLCYIFYNKNIKILLNIYFSWKRLQFKQDPEMFRLMT